MWGGEMRYNSFMRKKAWLPWFFLTILLLIVVLMAGVAYGKRVADVDIITSYLKKYATPTAYPTPTHTQLEFKELSLTGCNIKFLYPGSLNQNKKASLSALLENDGDERIGIDCNRLASQPSPLPVNTPEISFKGRKIKAVTTPNKTYLFSLTGYTLAPLQVEISRNLYPLFESSLQRIK